MRAILTNVDSGEIAVYEVPPPELQAGGILIQTHFSVISSGTERASLQIAKKSLIGKALSRPDLTRQVLDYARCNGIRAACEKVRSRLLSLKALGYSCSGVVIKAGAGAAEFRPGDHVACGGVGYASHCEMNFVPRNLAVRVPSQIPLRHAAITTIGAIAMQGLRQSQVSVGETVVVIGAGLVGVLTTQLARAAGCRVVAIDVDRERVHRAVDMGAHVGFVATDPRLSDMVSEFSRYGADAALITAATRSSEPLELAAKLLRDRGRIVIVGDVGLNVPRATLYAKELSVCLSRSYGPGRYDPTYEEGGTDYPIGHVRWTEKRNMEAFIDLLATGTLDVAPLLQRECSIEEADRAYNELKESRTYTVLIRYPEAPVSKPFCAPSAETRIARPLPRKDSLRVGSIGAGGFARSMIFPSLRKIKHATLEAVATASGVGAESARKVDGFRRTLTPGNLIADPNIDGIFVLTRHDSHARYVIEALRQGKPVFVEKPLCSHREELRAIRQTYTRQAEAGRSPFVMVGFNRRFAPFTQKVKHFFVGRREPMLVHIRVNAGYVPRDHWAQQEAGGRIVGEVCHFVDWALAVVASPITGVQAAALPDGTRYNQDNLVIALGFADGSLANLVYLANGDRAVAKEYFEVFCEGGVARLNDFRTLELDRLGKSQSTKSRQDKGHLKELDLTIGAMLSGHAAPTPFDEICQVTDTTLCIKEALGRAAFSGLDTPAPELPIEPEPPPVSSVPLEVSESS